MFKLNTLPSNWSVVPVQGKRPLGKGWNHTSWSPRELQSLLNQFPHCTGVGLLLGIKQNAAFMAVDVDSQEGSLKLKALASGEPLPKTVNWTSGRPERYSALFEVDQITATQLKSYRVRYRWAGKSCRTQLDNQLPRFRCAVQQVLHPAERNWKVYVDAT